MANTICTTSQFTMTDGVLGLSRSAMPRVVLEATQQSINDGPVTEHSSQANPNMMPWAPAPCSAVFLPLALRASTPWAMSGDWVVRLLLMKILSAWNMSSSLT